jgi:hypothetical protein
MRNVISELSTMKGGVTNYLMAMIKEIMEPLTREIMAGISTSQMIVSSIASTAKMAMGIAFNAAMSIVPGLNFISTMYKAFRMTYKLASNGLKLK